jgi:purine-binding chemotaxis protein CheW
MGRKEEFDAGINNLFQGADVAANGDVAGEIATDEDIVQDVGEQSEQTPEEALASVSTQDGEEGTADEKETVTAEAEQNQEETAAGGVEAATGEVEQDQEETAAGGVEAATGEVEQDQEETAVGDAEAATGEVEQDQEETAVGDAEAATGEVEQDQEEAATQENTAVEIDEHQWVVFALGDEEYALGISAVDSVVRLQPITAVPGAPAFVEGVTNLRGTVLPVVDLHKRFGLPPKEMTKEARIVVAEAGGNKVGMIVDAVLAVHLVSPETVEPPSPLVATVDSTYITGIAKVEDERLIILLDLDRVLAHI